MSWFQKLLPPKIKRKESGEKKAVPEGLWSKCASCDAVLYYSDLGNNLNVCPKCNHHNRISARVRLDLFLDSGGRYEIGPEVQSLDPLKFKDSKRYVDRLAEAKRDTDEDDALVVMQGSVKTVPIVAAAFEFSFMGVRWVPWWVSALYGEFRFASNSAWLSYALPPAVAHECRRDC